MLPLTIRKGVTDVDHTARCARPGAATAVDRLPGLVDAYHRPLRDLRISVTDRCNFRCSYCMPKEVFDKDYPFLPHARC